DPKKHEPYEGNWDNIKSGELMEDPFAQPTPAETYTTTTTKENRMTDDQNNAKVTATHKGGSGFDAPWIVIHGSTPAEVLSILEETETEAQPEQTQKVGADLG